MSGAWCMSAGWRVANLPRRRDSCGCREQLSHVFPCIPSTLRWNSMFPVETVASPAELLGGAFARCPARDAECKYSDGGYGNSWNAPRICHVKQGHGAAVYTLCSVNSSTRGKGADVWRVESLNWTRFGGNASVQAGRSYPTVDF